MARRLVGRGDVLNILPEARQHSADVQTLQLGSRGESGIEIFARHEAADGTAHERQRGYVLPEPDILRGDEEAVANYPIGDIVPDGDAIWPRFAFVTSWARMSFPPQFGATLTTYARPRILLVEDDRATREMFDYALRLSGFDVLSAADGLSALRLIDQHCIPNVVVLDLDLPQVSGIDVHQEIVSHAETCAIPVIVVTGTSWQSPSDVFRTLRKPINSDVLINVVRLALTSRQSETEPLAPLVGR